MTYNTTYIDEILAIVVFVLIPIVAVLWDNWRLARKVPNRIEALRTSFPKRIDYK